MLISLNWLKKFVDIDMPIDELVRKIGTRLVEVESIENLGEKYRGAVVAKVVECVDHPDSDHLHVCKIDDGGVAQNIERDENGLVQVVCGAPNAREGLLVAWLPPETIVPETFGTDDEFKLSARKLRGVMSFGMLASPRELGLSDEHEGILEIDPMMAKAGDDFAKAFELDDYLIEVENKSLTHRPDCFGIIGFAREVAAITGSEFHSPEWFGVNNVIASSAKQSIIDDKLDRHTEASSTRDDNNISLSAPTITLPDPKLCPRYECAVLSDIDKNKQLDEIEKSYLMRSKMRSISATVDITNLIMLETGQPLHAFDYDKLVKVSPTGKPDIIVRAAEKGEKMTLLDSKEIELDPKDIVVCAGNETNSVPIALAGAMGGASTEIDDTTTNILLESATFNLYNLRGTQFRHGIFSEAITRFTKGQPAELTDPVLRHTLQIFMDKTGATIASDITDNYALKTENPVLEISDTKVNGLLGSDYDYATIEKTLRALGHEISCDCSKSDKCDCAKIKVQAPWWRTDVNIVEDVIEDIGRVNGFDEITPALPSRSMTPVRPNKIMELKDKIREFLASAGANEILTYTFVSGDLLKKVGQDPENSYKLANSISPELQYIRQQIVPNILVKAYENLRVGYDKFALFELNQIFRKELELTEENVPKYSDNLAFVFADKSEKSNFYDAKNYLVKLGDKLDIKFEFQPIEKLPRHEAYFEPKRSALVFVGDVQVGVIGEIKSSVVRELKLPNKTSAFEIGLGALISFIPDHSAYKPVPKFPGTTRDICFQVADKISFAEVDGLLRDNLSELPDGFVWKIQPVDIYAPENSLKNITLRVEFYDYNKTIDAKFIGKVIEKIAKNAEEKLGAKII
ncbi:MAG: phenylalanine--tRNA ligase subunit beta [Candidatus Nomurabacteria bacterium]|jgi:phenylalanyl-tRNA synthetase beta chain|nr:phenylalanine--tRNA ligase subunit beta [Candidatus Nomurabacteria bacterium]